MVFNFNLAKTHFVFAQKLLLLFFARYLTGKAFVNALLFRCDPFAFVLLGETKRPVSSQALT